MPQGVGVANQTTMLRNETEEVQRRIKDAMIRKFGAEEIGRDWPQPLNLLVEVFDDVVAPRLHHADREIRRVDDAKTYLLYHTSPIVDHRPRLSWAWRCGCSLLRLPSLGGAEMIVFE